MNAVISPKGWSLLAASIVCASCFSQPAPAPLLPPSLEFRVEHYAGSPLAGPLTQANQAAAEAAELATDDALFIECRVLFLEFMPASALDSLATRTRLIAASRGQDPVLSSIVLASGARVGVQAEAASFVRRVDRGQLGRKFELATPTAALLPGTTVWFEATSQEWIQVPDSGRARKVVSLHVSRRAEGDEAPSVLLAVEDLAAPARSSHDGDEEETVQESAPVLRRELICLEDQLPLTGESLALVFRSPFGDREGALVAVLRAAKLSDDAGELLLAKCVEDLAPAAAEEAASAAKDMEIRTLASAYQALETARFHRPGIVFLTSRTGAELAEDLALSAEDEALAAYVRRLSDGDQAFDPEDTKQTGWKLEREAVLFLATLQIEDPPLAPELSGILIQHAGEVGRFPSLLRELIGRSSDLADYRTKLVEENRIFLEDSNPGARVRALDWLTAQGLAPDGFDPFGDKRERRKALSAAREQREAAAREGGAQ